MNNSNSLSMAIYGVGFDTECFINDENNINMSNDHRFGYVLRKNGKLIKAIKRTNPNGKWADYQLGGRFGGFKLKLGKISPAAFKKDIDFTQFNVTYAVNKVFQWFAKHDIEGSCQEDPENSMLSTGKWSIVYLIILYLVCMTAIPKNLQVVFIEGKMHNEQNDLSIGTLYDKNYFLLKKSINIINS